MSVILKSKMVKSNLFSTQELNGCRAIGSCSFSFPEFILQINSTSDGDISWLVVEDIFGIFMITLPESTHFTFGGVETLA